MFANPLIKHDNAKRTKVTLKATVLSMVLNILLAAGKIVCGIVFHAISVTADGFNNLSDCGSNVITIIGIKASSMPADKKHPYGHARSEYIAAMAASFLILLLAFELFSQSIDNIVSGKVHEFSIISTAVLVAGILVKTGMFILNRIIGKKYSSEVLLATSVDSISDVFASLVVLISLIVGQFTSFNPDGYVGALVAVVIAISGFGILKRTVSKLIGESPSPELTAEIKKQLLSYEGIYGIHDLEIHNYVNRMYASVHAEIDAEIPVLAAHELIDKIERDFAQNTDIVLTIHLDPVVLHDVETVRLLGRVAEIIKNISPDFVLHDFRVVKCESGTKLIFEVGVPYETKQSNEEILNLLYENLKGEFGLNYTFSPDIKRGSAEF